MTHGTVIEIEDVTSLRACFVCGLVDTPENDVVLAETPEGPTCKDCLEATIADLREILASTNWEG